MEPGAWSRIAIFLYRGPCLGADSWVEPTHVLLLSMWGFAQAGLRPGSRVVTGIPSLKGPADALAWTEARAPGRAGLMAPALWPGLCLCASLSVCELSHTWGHMRPAGKETRAHPG